MATVIPIDELRRSPSAALFQGGDEIAASIFVTAYPEVFVVEDGTAVFTAGDEQLTVEAGHIVTVPAETPHGFKNAGDGTLRVVSVHPSSTVQQTDL